MNSELSVSQLRQAVSNALKAYYKADTEPPPFQDLRIFQRLFPTETTTRREATNKILIKALDTLEVTNKKAAQLLVKHFLDGEAMKLISHQENIGEATAYRLQTEAIELLAGVIYTWEVQARQEQQRLLETRLERPTYTELIGVDDHLNPLLQLLTSAESPWLISLEGLGGIGKTSLADALARRAIQTGCFVDFGWISARPHTFNPGRGIRPVDTPALTAEQLIEGLLAQLVPDITGPAQFSANEALAALQAKFEQGPHLIVIDNLETVLDLETLLPTLRHLSQPAKFLLTSRESLHHEPGLHHYPVPELNQANTLRLIRREIELNHPPHLQDMAEADLDQVYRVVGGNPLAIRLVIGQTHVFALESILADLKAARGQKVETLYTYIYRQAWNQLNAMTRQVFLALLLVAEGQGSLDHLAELSEVDESGVRDALDWLVRLNLVDRQGSLQVQSYSIHPLTRTFLQRQAQLWL